MPPMHSGGAVDPRLEGTWEGITSPDTLLECVRLEPRGSWHLGGFRTSKGRAVSWMGQPPYNL